MLETITKAISSVIIGISLTVAGWFGYTPPDIPNNIGADTILTAGLSTYTLSGSGITSSAASITLTSFTLPQNDYPIQDTDLSSTFYVTIEPGNTTRQEFVSCTTVTQNAAGTATLSGCTRGLAPISPYTASTTLRFSHAGGTKLIFSNPPQLYDQAAFKGNDESITGTWTFASTSIPTLDSYLAPTDDADFASKKYIDDVAIAGGVVGTESTAGIWKGATALQSASSTLTSGGYGLCLQPRYASSSPYTNQVGIIPVTQNNGKISQSYLDLTQAYTWSGSQTFSNTGTMSITASTTFSATTTMAGLIASSTADKPIQLNGVNYTMPSSGGASSTVLSTNGSGGLTWESQDWHLLVATTTAVNMDTASSTLSAKSDLLFIIEPVVGVGSVRLQLQFNYDAGNNYGWVFATSTSNTSSSAGNSGSSIAIDSGVNSLTKTVWIRVSNIATNVKRLQINNMGLATGSNFPEMNWGGGVWNNTSVQITSFRLTSDSLPTYQILTGTRIRVYGSAN